MTKVRFVLLCDQAFLDQAGKLNMIGEFDRLYTSNDKATLVRGFLVAKMTGTPNKELSLKIVIFNTKSKREVLNREIGLRFDGNGTSGLLFEMINIEFNEFGEHKVALFEGKNELAEIELGVQKVSPQKAAKS